MGAGLSGWRCGGAGFQTSWNDGWGLIGGGGGLVWSEAGGGGEIPDELEWRGGWNDGWVGCLDWGYDYFYGSYCSDHWCHEWNWRGGGFFAGWVWLACFDSGAQSSAGGGDD